MGFRIASGFLPIDPSIFLVPKPGLIGFDNDFADITPY